MNKLTINHGSFNLDEIDLDHGTVTIGRATDNDIRLDDSAVSSHHAKIVTFFNVSYIEDLDSTNGTIVNGRSVKKYTLHTGDIVLLGKHQLLFKGSATPSTAGKSDATIVMSQSDVKNAMASKPESAPPINIAPAAPLAPLSTPPAPSPAPVAIATQTDDDNANDVLVAAERAPQRPSPVAPVATTAPPAATPISKRAPITKQPMRAVMENIAATPVENEAKIPSPLDSLEQHNEVFSLLNDDSFLNDDDDLEIKIGTEEFTAFDKDESLLIPAFIKSDKTAVNVPSQAKSTQTKSPPKPPAPAMKPPPMPPATPSQAAPPRTPPPAAKAPQRKPARKVLEDPSVSFGNPIEHSAPMGINEVDRVNQYREKSDTTNPGIGTGMPAVGDRTLLKQIITGDSAFSPSRNKFEIIQIVLGFVIFAIIALIAFASF